MYGIISDTHCHNWTMFGATNEDGVNSRLRIILDEIERAAKTVADQGGKYLFHAGDLFHVRGSIAPSVLNPTLETFEKVVGMGIRPVIICGNHDAEFRQTTDLGSAVNAMQSIGCEVCNKPTFFELDGITVLCVPWIQSVEEFYKVLGQEAAVWLKKFDLICHVALDNVFSYLSPNCVANPKMIYDVTNGSVRNIFAGHLHTHKMWTLDGNTHVCSVGAIAHHNWGDVGAKAGFVTVEDGNKVVFHASHAPKFVELTDGMSEEEVRMECDGNYVRATVKMTESEIKKFRRMLTDAGALGVTLICHEPAAVRADRIEIKQTETLDKAVCKFIEARIPKEIADDVQTEALSVLGRL